VGRRLEEVVTATAEVRTMPWTRLLTTERLPLARRKELLTWLAQEALRFPPEAVTLMASAWAHDSVSGPQLDERWNEFKARLAIADAADQGLLDWDWACGSCGHPLARECFCNCCPSASDQAHADADVALEHLAAGTP
jgi:hypothetical protein